jgi:hypothetical protein
MDRYIRIPLVLNLFSKPETINCLAVPQIQQVTLSLLPLPSRHTWVR